MQLLRSAVAQPESTSHPEGAGALLGHWSQSRLVGLLAAGLGFLGIALRLQRYFLGRSFRGDEATLALAIKDRSLLELVTQPLGGPLTAPVGFAAAEKLVTLALGRTDFMYRLLPLLAGVLSVVLMYYVSRRAVAGPLVAFCVGAFALNWSLAFYASDLKQYSTDALFSVAIYLAASRYYDDASRRNGLALFVLGLIAIAFSQSAVFVLACVPPVVLIKYRRERRLVVQILAATAISVAVFVALYFRFYRSIGENGAIVRYWDDLDALMPLPPWQDPGWFVTRIGSFLLTVLNMPGPLILPVLLLVAGIVSFIRSGRWHWAAWSLAPAFATMLASALVNYPFKGRLILFLVPGTLLAIGEGAAWLLSFIRSRPALHAVLSWLVVLALLWTPGQAVFHWLQQPRSAPYTEDIKPALQFIRTNKRPGDLILVYRGAMITYRYYAPFYGLAKSPTLYLEDYRRQPGKYKETLADLPPHQRVWLVFSFVKEARGNLDERQLILGYARSLGAELVTEYDVSNGISSAHLLLTR